MQSLKALKAAVAKCLFNPREPGPLSTICSVNDADYLLQRGIEQLLNAKRFTGQDRVNTIRDAIAILVYAMLLNGNDSGSEKVR